MRFFDSIVRNLKVACILPNLALVLLASTHAQSRLTPVVNESRTVEQEVSVGDRLVRQSASKLRQHASVSANVRHRIDLFGQKLWGSGNYRQLQAGDRLLVGMELKIQLGSQMSIYQQVSDGRYLWVRRHLPAGSELSRIDMRRVRKKLASQNQLAVGPLPLALNSGGLPALVSQLADNFCFEDPRPASLYGVDVWAVRGNRNSPHDVDQTGGTATTDSPTPAPASRPFPDFVPRQVRLVFSRDDLFPYRLEYQSVTGQPIVIMEIFEVRINEPLNPALFAYRPPRELEIKDLTDEYLQKIARRHRDTVDR